MGLAIFFLGMPIVFFVSALLGMVGGCLVAWTVLRVIELFEA